MTDLERFQDLLADWKVDVVVKEHDNLAFRYDGTQFGPGIELELQNQLRGGETSIRETPGYSGFTSSWYFTEDGAFIATGAWE